MAINETILGPNSSSFTWDASETTSTIMNAMDAYITSKGWTLYDNAAPQAIGGTAPVGRIYRALQEGSTTLYRYVGIAMNTTTLKFRIYATWDPATHTGTREIAMAAGFSSLNNASNMTVQVGTAGAGFLLFVNPKWLGLRTRTSANAMSYFQGAFEILKENGEDPTIPSVCHITTETQESAAYGSIGLVTVCQAVTDTTLAASVATGRTTFSTTAATYVAGYDGVAIKNVQPATNMAFTMTAVEASNEQILFVRGRITGVKHAMGPVFTDMDTATILCGSNYMHDNTGTPVVHHYIVNGSGIQLYVPV
jgi:hypothetical protein